MASVSNEDDLFLYDTRELANSKAEQISRDIKFLSLDIADERDQRIGILFVLLVLVSQTMLIKPKILTVSRLHYFYTSYLTLRLDLWWTILALLCRPFLLGTEELL